ncbi:DUF2336 domain-containing protein [Aureimonas sp. AU4]|uniref:DUF2336 domain-containing protein n=1 Tax=Aureimonas sp. AU4 TaxID=1638163 RepID=UPI000780C4B7|nr:DUF2336 domain-containing protein [Aureimonas sp. AU4]
MKDASPKVFRSLERQGGPDFDDVVTAAVAAFAALRRPTPRQCDDLARLVLPLWDRVSGDTLRNCAASLSHSERVPRSVVERLVAAPIEVSAPFLVSSQLLTEEDLARLAASPDERVRRLATSRAAREADAPPPPSRPDIEAPPLAPFDLSGEAGPVQPARPVALGTAEITASAAGVRETLRRMVLGSRAAAARLSPADLIQAAMERDGALFADRLAAMLRIDAETLALIEADATGERLAVALKALEMRPADAMSVLLLMKPRIGHDVAAFDAIGRYYAQLRSEDCRRLVGTAQAPAAPAARAPARPRIEPVAEPRSTFGRRADRPDGRSAKG